MKRAVFKDGPGPLPTKQHPLAKEWRQWNGGFLNAEKLKCSNGRFDSHGVQASDEHGIAATRFFFCILGQSRFGSTGQGRQPSPTARLWKRRRKWEVDDFPSAKTAIRSPAAVSMSGLSRIKLNGLLLLRALCRFPAGRGFLYLLLRFVGKGFEFDFNQAA